MRYISLALDGIRRWVCVCVYVCTYFYYVINMIIIIILWSIWKKQARWSSSKSRNRKTTRPKIKAVSISSSGNRRKVLQVEEISYLQSGLLYRLATDMRTISPLQYLHMQWCV